MNALAVHVEGIGVWSPALAGFDAWRARLTGAPATAQAAKPPALCLPATERRRAPTSVLLAVEVAAQAVAMSGRDPAALACVFASAYGDPTISDYLCATLARAPGELSPTRFHHSVHNAPAGYWTIASGCRAASSAVCAGTATVGAGLLEAAAFACAERQPVLLVCSDIAGCGPLGEVTGCRHDFGAALVLSPQAGPRSLARITLRASAASSSPAASPTGDDLADNPCAAILPLLATLAAPPGAVTLAASDGLALDIRVEPPA